MEQKEDNELLQKLERRRSWDGHPLVKYDDSWVPEMFLRSVISTKQHFKAKDTDIILATLPKSGTTWLKALTFSIANRTLFPISQSPLLTNNPHTLVPFLKEHHITNDDINPIPGNQRIFSSHLHFNLLPESVRDRGSRCRIIYICRNPMDQFVSLHHFFAENKMEPDAAPLGLLEAFDMFCEGVCGFGPFWGSMLGYWKAHLENPRKVLFLRYEDLKEDIASNVKKIAEFMGCPFSVEEEERGVIEEIVGLCSFESLKSLEVNKSGYVLGGLLKNSTYFRKGEVGDWANYFTPAMVRRVEDLMEINFQGSGLTFKTTLQQ